MTTAERDGSAAPVGGTSPPEATPRRRRARGVRVGSRGFDLAVIGTGAAGMAAAIRGSELGASVLLVESGTVGGTCVNVGCIPSKHLVAAAGRVHEARVGFEGVAGCDPALEWARVVAHRRALVDRLRQSKYHDVLASLAEVTLVRGHGRLAEGGVGVAGVRYAAAKVVVATGSSPWTPPIPGIDRVEVLDSTSLLKLERLPRSLLVLGGGSVGLELGQALARFGTRVTVVERLVRLLPGEEPAASEALARALEAEGVEIHTSARVERVESMAGGIAAHVTEAEGIRAMEAERLLVAAGRRPNTQGMGLEEAGVEVDGSGAILVDACMRSRAPRVFAAGDVTGGPAFVYVAAAAGRVAAGNALGGGREELDLRAVPRVTFTDPQVAAVGPGAEEARRRGLDVRVARLGLEHVPRALVEHREEGWVELVAEAGTGRVLGVHAVAPHAGELMGEATLAVRLGLAADDLVETLHPYLTWVEALRLAAQSLTVDPSRRSCCA